MDDKSRIKGIILDFSTLGAARKKKAGSRAFKSTFNDELVRQATRGQAQINKAYKVRSKKIVNRLRTEVLTQLMSKDKKN